MDSIDSKGNSRDGRGGYSITFLSIQESSETPARSTIARNTAGVPGRSWTVRIGLNHSWMEAEPIKIFEKSGCQTDGDL